MFEAWQPNLARRFGVAAPLRGTGWQHGSRSASHFGQQWLGLQMMAQSVAGERDISLGGATLGRICAPSWQQITEQSGLHMCFRRRHILLLPPCVLLRRKFFGRPWPIRAILARSSRWCGARFRLQASGSLVVPCHVGFARPWDRPKRTCVTAALLERPNCH